ncbi:protein RRP5 homolog [Anopheles aquasalis]|uniref:protein RRP5 homolog n=1 Tax=Anopheles aquasalis TaxID=42839 RepID=UPI00215A7E55|nr:protein RRP5 homolog [Anopheles aquasalis]
MVYVEASFPRGKKAETDDDGLAPKKKFKPRKRENYGASTEEEAKQQNPRPKDRRRVLKEEKEDELEEQELACKASNLGFVTLQPGMLVLGCVQRTFKTHMEVTLPGRITGTVPVPAISEAYTKRLQAMIDRQSFDCPTLDDLYTVNELVYVKVMEKQTFPRQLTLSLNPHDLHSSFTASQLVPGLVLSATLTVEEDHGYTMDVGIRNVRAFLPRENLCKNPTDIGRNLFCAIEKVTRQGTAVTVILKAFRPKESRLLNVSMANLDTIVPGCVVPFTVGSVVKRGLRGTLFDDTVAAFVNETMLTQPNSKPESYTMFQQLDATVLYVMPVTKHVFVSLAKYPGNRAEGSVAYAAGQTIENAHVVAVTSAGAWLQFAKDYRALLPKSVIMKRIKGNYEESVVMSKYHVGSVHTLRILRYDPLNRTFIVCDTLENAADELTVQDIQIGEVYQMRVKNLLDTGGFFVEQGAVRGWVRREWFDRTQHVKEGARVQVRAMMFEHGTPYVQFTNRHDLLKKGVRILSSHEQLQNATSILTAPEAKQFHGLVVHETREYFIIKFANDIKGLLMKNLHDIEQDTVKMHTLRIGSVVQVTVHQYNAASQKLLLSLPLHSTDTVSTLTEATVIAVLPTGVEIALKEDRSKGTIPVQYFSDFAAHNPLYVGQLKEGQKLSVVKLRNNTYSVRDVEYCHKNPMLLKENAQGAIVRASYYSRDGQPFANLLLSDYAKPIEVRLRDEDKKAESIPDGEIIYVRISYDRNGKTDDSYKLKANTQRRVVCPRGVEHVYEYIESYMRDISCLIERYKKAGKTFANFTVGQQVRCTIESEVAEKFVVKVQSEEDDSELTAKGIAEKPAETSSNFDIGEQVVGRIIWVDVVRQVVQVCIDPARLQFIEQRKPKASELNPIYRLHCSELYSNEYVHICCATKKAGPLIVVPVKHHYNDALWKTGGKAVNIVLPLHSLGDMVFAVTKYNYGLYNGFDNMENPTKLYAKPQKRPTGVQNDGERLKLRSQGKLRYVRELPETFHESLLDDDQAEKSESEIDESDGNDSDASDSYRDSVDDDEDEDFVCSDEEEDQEEQVQEEITEVKTKPMKKQSNQETAGHKGGQKGVKEPKKTLPVIAVTKSEKQLKVTDDTNNSNKKSKKRQIELVTTAPPAEVTQKKRGKKKQVEVAASTEQEKKRKNQNAKSKPKPVGPTKEPTKRKLESGAEAANGLAKNKKKKKKSLPAGVNDMLDSFCDTQLDGGCDFLFGDQLDGAVGLIEPTKKVKKAKKRKHNETTDNANKQGSSSSNGKRVLPGATNFWDSTPVYKRDRNPSDSDDDEREDEEGEQQEGTSKRMTGKERFEAMKQEEERLRKIEEELADPSVAPHTPDQFDRLVVAQPNNSMLWIRYMAFHMESAELDKARAVARKALKAINFREEAELLNVWIALLNLELRYETVAAFKEVLQEATQYNDAFKVYRRVLDILIDCQKLPEVTELLELLVKRFRKETDMWYLVADAWYRIGQSKKAKPLLSQAMKSLPNREHIPLIVKFAFLHNRHGNRDEAHLLFEQILTSYPKRTDIWSQYVDMLVKDGLIEEARQILERAIVQRLPMKNMKTLYTKYVTFEEKHGDRESVHRVKQMAADYVQTQLNNAGVTTAADKGRKK